jgi:hypothetical protein
MLPAGFESTIPASERPQTHALERRGHWDWLLTFLLKLILSYKMHKIYSSLAQNGEERIVFLYNYSALLNYFICDYLFRFSRPKYN